MLSVFERGNAPTTPARSSRLRRTQGRIRTVYQYYFATERGKLGYSENRHDFNKLIWKNVSPKWDFDDATFDRTVAPFNNPDHAAIVIHNYRWRLSLAKGEPRYDDREQML